MIIKIYDYSNKATELVIPDDKEITQIYVTVLSGDETGFFVFKDGSSLSFDASNSRIMTFFDGDYIVEGENIKRWIDFNPEDDGLTWSYSRQSMIDRF